MPDKTSAVLKAVAGGAGAVFGKKLKRDTDVRITCQKDDFFK